MKARVFPGFFAPAKPQRFIAGIKKPGRSRVLSEDDQLLDLGFFVRNVLANYRIKFFDLEFLRHGALVFVSSIEVTGTGT